MRLSGRFLTREARLHVLDASETGVAVHITKMSQFSYQLCQIQPEIIESRKTAKMTAGGGEIAPHYES